ncbi:hypothetical protein OV079_10680 [Nannocystis pusilla]|uniref:Uncharacterized protein n=1 Tax=Nannocystis pusilla TaxID=889268 RepID=A0A9X3EL09_9BACT|nr:hypothetical protein [Nannocystis pusilla]MCY1006019.1 hypothetical protein [Nannocystis pusilla]
MIGEAGHGEHRGGARRRSVRGRGFLGVDELAVDLVDDEEDAGLHAHLAERGEVGGAQHHAGRVARRGDDEGAGLRGDGRPHALGRDREALARVGGDGHDVDAEEVREAAVVGVVGLGDEDLIADVAGGGDGEQERLAAADGDEDLARGDGAAAARGVEAVVVLGQSCPIGQVALGRAVGDDALVVGPVGGEHRLHGGEVGLADVEVMHGDPARPRLIGVGGEAADRGRGGVEPAAGQAGCGHGQAECETVCRR